MLITLACGRSIKISKINVPAFSELTSVFCVKHNKSEKITERK